MNMAKERISELEDCSVENIYNEEQRKQEQKYTKQQKTQQAW